MRLDDQGQSHQPDGGTVETMTAPARNAALVRGSFGQSQRPLPTGPASLAAMLTGAVAALATAFWPWLAQADAQVNAVTSTALVMVLLPVIMLLVLAQMTNGAMDAKALALLGVLAAVIAAIRPLGSGVGGVETVFFVMILAGRVFGPGFGYALGAVSILASALLTGGVGPWMGMQMACSAWIGAGAGWLPARPRGRAELAMLAAYGVVVSYLFGALMNLWFWPTMAGSGPQAGGLGFLPGGPVAENLRRFATFTLLTSTTSWDTVRAVTCAACILALGKPTLALLRRAATRAAFIAPETPPGTRC